MRRVGLTLLELVVVLAIIGVLIALLLPAVQYGREASRRMQCSHHLRQFVIAVSLYESAWRVFPPGSDCNDRSVHYSCLPYLEQSDLIVAAQNDKNLPVFLFRCPSDGGPAKFGKRATTNYVCNSGTWWDPQSGFDGPFRYWTWMKGGPPCGASEMTRGLSNTSALTEIIHADGGWRRMRVNWYSAQTYSSYSQIDDFAAYCQSLPPDPEGAGIWGDPFIKGAMWYNGSVSITLYNHVTPPNQPSSLNGGMAHNAAMSASSFHRGIVNVAYLDGHVAACSDKIDIGTWRSFAPR